MRKYNKEKLQEIVNKCNSKRQVLRELGLKKAGGNYKTLNDKIKEFDICIKHFTGQGWLKGVTHNYNNTKIKLTDILSGNHPQYQSYKLKNRLLEESYFNYVCNSCGLTEWKNQKIPLELDHINGMNNDHRLENLQLLCPNCHAQTGTYRGKNIKK